ncbi:hypothetical protein [Gimesia aquarii]|uniref:Uncharacterized protein n=1 Tax=Gimesia aquarii TaxID=2527964 RepID=A0A517WW30_9PLAN|nr:hypothetical protein [Gimesia aquarii]QDU09464.1 hypothetical protein V202x_28390 [Gimesia aquarii]
MDAELKEYLDWLLLVGVSIAITSGLNVGQTMWDLVRRAAREKNWWLVFCAFLFVMPETSQAQCFDDSVEDMQIQTFGEGVVAPVYGVQAVYTRLDLTNQRYVEVSEALCGPNGCHYSSRGQLCSIGDTSMTQHWWAVQGFPSSNLAQSYGFNNTPNGTIGSAAYQCDCNGTPSGCPPGHTWDGQSCVPDNPLPPCGPGYIRDDLGFCNPDPNNPPDPCGPGYIRDEFGQCNPDPNNPPDPCPPNHTRDEFGTCNPEPCPPGHTADENGNCIEDPCPPGQSRDENGQCVDDPCPPGFSRDQNGECVEDPCPNGQGRDENGDCVPLPCPNEGEVRDIDGNCVVPCARDEVRDENGNCVPGECQEGYYRDESGQCVPGCPEGQTADDDGNCQCPEGTEHSEDGLSCVTPPCEDTDGDGCCDEIDPDPEDPSCGCTRTETDTCGECPECEKTMDSVLQDYIDLFMQFGVDLTPFQSTGDVGLSWVIPLPQRLFSSGTTLVLYSDERSMDAGPIKTAVGTARAAFRNICLTILVLLSVRAIMRIFMG